MTNDEQNNTHTGFIYKPFKKKNIENSTNQSMELIEYEENIQNSKQHLAIFLNL